MNLEDILVNEINCHKRQILNESTYVRYLVKSYRSCNDGCQWLGGGESGELLINKYRVLVLQNEELWDSVVVITTHNVNIYNTTEMYT